MPSTAGAACVACGGDNNLIQCDKCDARLQSKGIKAAICAQCRADETLLDSVGMMLATSSTSPGSFQCRPCSFYEKRLRDEALFAAVRGPSPTDILKTVAQTAPWFLVLRRASPEQQLSGLNKLKRRTDFSATAHELAEGLASKEVLPALLLQSMSANQGDPLCQ